MAFQMMIDGGLRYVRANQSPRVTSWPDGTFTADVKMQWFLNRNQRDIAGSGEGYWIVHRVPCPSATPTSAEIYMELRKIQEFMDVTDV